MSFRPSSLNITDIYKEYDRVFLSSCLPIWSTNEPSRGENQQCGFRTGPTQTGLYKHRSRLEA